MHHVVRHRRAGPWRVRAAVAAIALAWVALLVFAPQSANAGPLTPIERLGKQLFFDTNLSTPPGQSCGSCHAPETGFSGPRSEINAAGGVHPGAAPQRFGNRMPPTVAYAGASPVLHSDADAWRGGMFWDGHAPGWTSGDPLIEQAQAPFLNPLEQNMRGTLQVVMRVSKSEYAGLFEQVWGPGSLDPIRDLAGSYERISRSIAAYERSAEVSPFSSRYDFYLRGQAKLTGLEMWGLRIFEGKGQCNACHPSQLGENWASPLFTDFSYANIGMPRNPMNPFYTAPIKENPDGADWIDPGLGGFLAAHGDLVQAQLNWGKHKVPTLRNVALKPSQGFVKAFGHNAFFKSLADVVHFFNSRDVSSWPAPEVAVNVSSGQIGNLGLTPVEEAAVVAFLGTLTDGFVPATTPRKPPLPGETGGVPIGPLTGVELFASRPNPAGPQAAITFALPEQTQVELAVFDLNGREVTTLASGACPAGTHAVVWDGRDRTGHSVADGAYFYRLRAGPVTQVRRLIWIR